MAEDSEFITTLRQQWTATIGAKPSFAFATVAGDSDEFVPTTSSLKPFEKTYQRVVYGNHLQIVKPDDSNHLGFKVLVDVLTGASTAVGPFDAARRAVESRDFQQAIDTLWPHRDALDDGGLVTLALALESVGRQNDALELLSTSRKLGTDPMGVLAGRLKRRWLAERRRADAEAALTLYKDALARAEAKSDASQAFYHAINCGFMNLAFGGDFTAAREYARKALDYCTKSGIQDVWRYATEGEAYLYLGDTARALEGYGKALALTPEPRQAASMYQQAVRAADLTGEDHTVGDLAAVFGQRTAV
jgi:tetratricopeptide (TPR) repeat protein